MDVCIILQKKHLIVHEHSYDSFQQLLYCCLTNANCTSVLQKFILWIDKVVFNYCTNKVL